MESYGQVLSKQLGTSAGSNDPIAIVLDVETQRPVVKRLLGG
jgi:hypothetical protein